MIKNIILASILAVVALGAHAQSAGAVAGSLSGAAANSASISSSNPAATAGASTGAATAGNAQNIIFNTPGQQTIEHTGTSTIKTAPQVYAPPMGVTAPCRVAMSAGVSVIGVGVAAGGSVEDVNCNMRELSRLYHGIGAVDKAVKVADGAFLLMCQTEEVAKVMGDVCPPTAQQRRDRSAEAPASVAPVAVAPASKVASMTCVIERSDSGIKTTTCK